MKRSEAMLRLKAHEAELKQLGVERLHLFGSTVRDEAAETSDVDLFFDYVDDDTFGLFRLMDVQETAARILGCRADVTTRDSLHRVLRDAIIASAQRVF